MIHVPFFFIAAMSRQHLAVLHRTETVHNIPQGNTGIQIIAVVVEEEEARMVGVKYEIQQMCLIINL